MLLLFRSSHQSENCCCLSVSPGRHWEQIHSASPLKAKGSYTKPLNRADCSRVTPKPQLTCNCSRRRRCELLLRRARQLGFISPSSSSPPNSSSSVLGAGVSVGDPGRTQSQPHKELFPALPFLCQGFPLVALSTRMDPIFSPIPAGTGGGELPVWLPAALTAPRRSRERPLGPSLPDL